jgi:hypothetical protein
MRLALVTAVALLGAAAPAEAARVDLMVVGKSKVLRGAKPVALKTARVKVGARRCAVAARTPLAALARTRLSLRLRDYGRCSGRVRDATGLYVRGVGPDVARGRNGWVFKIGHASSSAGAGDAAAGLRGGSRLLWFWCRQGRRGCQRTLGVRPAARTVARGSVVRVRVTAYDDFGAGVPAAGATVRVGRATARAGANGVAAVRVPRRSATLSVMATKSGMVRSFPIRIRVT